MPPIPIGDQKKLCIGFVAKRDIKQHELFLTIECGTPKSSPRALPDNVHSK